MSRMRTISQCFEYIKEIDPQTQISKHAIRQLVINGNIPSCRCGVKFLVSLEVLESYLSGGNVINQPSTPQSGVIRAISQ
jgi:hypothetical protein